MRPLTVIALSCTLALTGFAAAPPALVPPEVLKLIDRLADEDASERQSAREALSARGEDVLPALRQAGRNHDDPDVRLAALALAGAIEKELYREVRRFAAGDNGYVVGIAVSPDGKRLISSTWDTMVGDLLIWE